ncbi:c-type cytochrome [Paraburkholderia elongata]|uniref:c-type cytochrome n=1 Tax=Paraburkholderia elongata TaxID=2675747 RepID=UPI001F27279F|nr:c-type cytochrome [Paraburkholderia elongata]
MSVQACFSCHAAGGKGNGARFPSIAGEPAAFAVAHLHEFKARTSNAEASFKFPGSGQIQMSVHGRPQFGKFSIGDDG